MAIARLLICVAHLPTSAAQTLSDVPIEVRQGSSVLASVFPSYVSFLFT